MKSIVWLLLTSAVLATEPLKLPLEVGTFKTLDGKVFQDATITGHDAVGVKIVHSAGVARVEFERLPRELAARFPSDKEAAKEQLDRESKHEATHDRAVEKATGKTLGEDVEDDEDDPAADTPVETQPELKGDPMVRINALKAYIRRLEAGIAKATETVTDARKKAEKYEMTATTSVKVRDKNGSISTESVTNKSRLTRAKFQQKRAAREQAKIDEAQQLISQATKQIAELQDKIN